MTFTTAAFDRSSSWRFEAFPYRTAPKGPPSSLVQFRTAVWTGDARDTRPKPDAMRAAEQRQPLLHRSPRRRLQQLLYLLLPKLREEDGTVAARVFTTWNQE